MQCSRLKSASHVNRGIRHCVIWLFVLATSPVAVFAEGEWEITPQSELALERGLAWLAHNQGPEGNWDSNDLGIVGLGALAFLADGHLPGRGKYGDVVERALNYVSKNARPSGLLNIAAQQRDMYNHGLSTFVLGQAHGMTNNAEIGRTLDRALKLIAYTQGGDGSWGYRAQRSSGDLSLSVMQAKALRSAVDSGFEVQREVIQLAIKSVRTKYTAKNGARGIDNPKARIGPGQFTYNGSGTTVAMAAAGVVCLQEFGQYDDWRIKKSMAVVTRAVKQLKMPAASDKRVPFDAYTLYYVGQAIYQLGGRDWQECYPILRDHLVRSQSRQPGDTAEDGYWRDPRFITGGKPSRLFGTAVGCFILAIPNRYLPILQEGKIESIRKNLGQ